ncbi:hypothetical protein Q3A66_10950 [Hymenobacter sp. BT770]|uniref:hypothetical protein n=1 Tax=Hymenobacter sp. BT770 TaxID=2886942 RepID=UPI001D0FA576|nr:hypothetical protein [Hymenobacter sp. BT770]MCC3154888.1 hypothetical protein [Hymenobacter sp. BT770]MDO3415587.1 hypothetical protein [Hymenobacter sp. BT770]
MPLLLLVSAVLFSSCSKKETEPTIDFGADEGITYRDASNMPNGPQDPTDWTSDATWNAQERALFPEINFDLNGPQQPALVGARQAFPNPALAGQANWTLQTQRGPGGGAATYTLRVVFVNRKYQVLQRLEPVNLILSQSYMFDYAKMGAPAKEVFRIYYVVNNADGLVYKGHGDLCYGQ